uniref:GAG-pre-integrase domain-containing protein n=1 Tax=Tanacetum cinerariifolium TaxID=118510 RepID=A0A699HSU1_TANCI|nr:hypothetical protein [Tanacetum cinerariifolium]
MPLLEEKRSHCQKDRTAINVKKKLTVKDGSYAKSPKTQFRSVFGISQGFSFYHSLRLFRVVIEFGDSYEAPKDVSDTGSASEGSAKKKGRTIAVTIEDMQKRRNDVKARTTLLLALPDEHQLRFGKRERDAGANFQHTAGHSKNNSGKEEVNTASFPTASTQVSPASANVAAASFSHDTVCAYIASQSNGSQIKYEDINQINKDDIEEMDIKCNMALLSMRADRFWKKMEKKITIQGTDVAGFDKSKGSKTKEQAPKALMAIDGVEWDWSYMANEEESYDLVADQNAPIEFALMAKSSSKNKVFDNSLCSKACKKNTDSLNTKITELSEKLSDSKTMLYHYKLGLSRVKARLVEFKNQEIELCEKIRGLEFNVECKNDRIERLTNELEELKKEKEGLDIKLTGYWDIGCSRHMTGNISYISDYEPYDGGYVSFGQGGGKITGKGRDFKLKDDINVFLRTPRQHNMYSINLNNIVPHKDLTCLVTKALADECMLCHRRLGHLNFKTINKLVRHNLVRGLPSKCLKMTILVLLA